MLVPGLGGDRYRVRRGLGNATTSDGAQICGQGHGE